MMRQSSYLLQDVPAIISDLGKLVWYIVDNFYDVSAAREPSCDGRVAEVQERDLWQ